MKKKRLTLNNWLSIVMATILCSFGFQACSSSNDSDPTEAYIKAVDNNDYAKAHEVLDQFKAQYIKASQMSGFHTREIEKAGAQFWNAANYIYKAEMQYLLPQNDPEADRRLLYTLDDFTPIGTSPEANHIYSLSEHNDNYQDFEAYVGYAEGYNKLCLEMIRVALRNNNVEFAKEVEASMKDNFHQNMDDSGETTYTYTLNDRARSDAQKLIEDYEARHNN